jgi:hypothetical protein
MSKKSNEHKKHYPEDKFAREFYCDHARLNQLRTDKKLSKKKTRRINKQVERGFYDEDYD